MRICSLSRQCLRKLGNWHTVFGYSCALALVSASSLSPLASAGDPGKLLFGGAWGGTSHSPGFSGALHGPKIHGGIPGVLHGPSFYRGVQSGGWQLSTSGKQLTTPFAPPFAVPTSKPDWSGALKPWPEIQWGHSGRSPRPIVPSTNPTPPDKYRRVPSSGGPSYPPVATSVQEGIFQPPIQRKEIPPPVAWRNPIPPVRQFEVTVPSASVASIATTVTPIISQSVRSSVSVQPNVMPTTAPVSTRTAAPAVLPRPNVITAVTSVPKSRPPMQDRVYRINPTEAHEYATRLAELVSAKLDLVELTVGKGANKVGLHKDVEQLRKSLAFHDSRDSAFTKTVGHCWQFIEPTMVRLMENEAIRSNGEINTCCRQISAYLRCYSSLCDANLSREQFGSTPVRFTEVPTGDVLVLVDPALPVGSCLMVDNWTVICGGTSQHELTTRRCSVAEAIGLPICNGPRLNDVVQSREQAMRQSILLRLPPDTATPVNYILNDRYDYTMRPGEQQSLPDSSQWVAAFDRGNDAGVARVNLNQKIYNFGISNDQWVLEPAGIEVELDNTESDQDFTVVINDQPVTIPAGESKQIVSEKVLVMKYDRAGTDLEPARKLLNKSSTLKLGVDPQTNTWDWVIAQDQSGSRTQDPQDATVESDRSSGNRSES